MKPQHFVAVAGFLLLTAMILMAVGQPQRVSSPEAPPPDRRIAMIGEGEFQVQPDLVRVSFGVKNIGASAAEAGASNLALLYKVDSALVAAVSNQDRSEFSQPSISAITHQDYFGELQITGFQADSLVTVSLKSLGRLQHVIDAALGSGATSVDEVSYQVEDPEAAKQQTITRALENARARADGLMAFNSVALGTLIDFEVLTSPTIAETNRAGILVYHARVRAVFSY